MFKYKNNKQYIKYKNESKKIRKDRCTNSKIQETFGQEVSVISTDNKKTEIILITQELKRIVQNIIY